MEYTSYQEIKLEAKGKMEKSLEVLHNDLGGLRTGRASTALLDGLEVMAYGQPTPLNQVASLSTPDSMTIGVSVWDKTVAPAVEKAIREANLGLNPASDGTLIRIPLPPLTAERRKELTKIAAGYGEQAKQSIRHVRHDAMEANKNYEKAEDSRRSQEEDLEKLSKDYTAKVDEILKDKNAEIMSIG